MKRNNSFRMTFYMGLLVIFFMVATLTSILINVYKFVYPKIYQSKKVEVVTENEIQQDVETVIQHDTVKIYVEKPIVEIKDTIKHITVSKPKLFLPVVQKRDTVKITDTLN